MDGKIAEYIEELTGQQAVKFKDLLAICEDVFGDYRTKGSHHIFKTPWAGDPRINLQKDGKDAKKYQVRQVVKALEKLLESSDEEDD